MVPISDIDRGPAATQLSADDPVVRAGISQLYDAGLDAQQIGTLLQMPVTHVRDAIRGSSMGRYDVVRAYNALVDMGGTIGLMQLIRNARSPIPWVNQGAAQTLVAIKSRRDDSGDSAAQVILSADFLDDPDTDPPSDTAISGPVQHDIQHDYCTDQ